MKRTACTLFIVLTASVGLAACGSSRGSDSDRPTAGILDGGLVVRPSALYFVGMDKNADFQVDRAEFSAGLAAAFKAADANESEFLTPIELADWSQTWAGDRYVPPGFMAYDKDANQKITEAEFSEVLNELFDRFDRNDDGTITRAEMVERLERHRGKTRARPRFRQMQNPRRRRRR